MGIFGLKLPEGDRSQQFQWTEAEPRILRRRAAHVSSLQIVMLYSVRKESGLNYTGLIATVWPQSHHTFMLLGPGAHVPCPVSWRLHRSKKETSSL